MRRILALVLLAAVCSFPLTGCTKKSSPTSASSSSGPSFTYPFLFSIGGYGSTAPIYFDDITGVAVSGNNIFVGDDSNEDIEVFDLNGNFITYFYPYENSDENYYPEGMAADNHGNLYVSDWYQGSIDIYDVRNFSVTTVAPGDSWYTYNTVSGDCEPEAVAVDGQGTLYVSDYCNEIYKIYQSSVTGSSTQADWTSAGNANINSGDMNDPTGIAVSPDGNHVYLADTDNNVVQIYDNNLVPTGIIGDAAGASSTVTGKFDSPTDVHLDNEGNLLVSDQDNARIQKFSPSGSYLGSIGTEGSFSAGELDSPFYLTVDSSDNVYVTDNNLGQVNKYAPN